MAAVPVPAGRTRLGAGFGDLHGQLLKADGAARQCFHERQNGGVAHGGLEDRLGQEQVGRAVAADLAVPEVAMLGVVAVNGGVHLGHQRGRQQVRQDDIAVGVEKGNLSLQIVHGDGLFLSGHFGLFSG